MPTRSLVAGVDSSTQATKVVVQRGFTNTINVRAIAP